MYLNRTEPHIHRGTVEARASALQGTFPRHSTYTTRSNDPSQSKPTTDTHRRVTPDSPGSSQKQADPSVAEGQQRSSGGPGGTSAAPGTEAGRTLGWKERYAAAGWSPEEVFTAANALSTARMVAGPYVFHLILQGELEAAIGWICAAAFSDWADGYLAKRHNNRSHLGSYLDPFADKIFIGCVIAGIGWRGMVPWWVTAVVLGRDAVLLVAGFGHRAYIQGWRWNGFEEYFRLRGEGAAPVVKPLLVSKFNTCIQFVTFGGALMHALYGFPDASAMDLLCKSVLLTTASSGVAYAWEYKQGKAFR